ncbi:hypothetical protein [Mucilaginibacter pineti]|nr:hypothetical protein [Mucilaginibacter pineti]
MYQLSYSVSSFSQQIIPIKNAAGQKTNSLAVNASLKDSLDVLYFYLYDSQNKLYDTLTQTSSYSYPFGTIRDSVAAGAYTVVFMGIKDVEAVNGYKVNGPTVSRTTALLSWPEVFSKKIAINVSASTPNQHLVLDRVVGQIQVNIQDALPSNYASVKAQLPGDSTYYAIYNPTNPTGVGDAIYNRTISAQERAASPPFQFSFFTRQFSSPFTLTLSFYDAQGTLLFTKAIPNVTCKQNTRTILTGKLVSNTSSNFQITFNSDWGSVNNMPF